LVNKVTNFKYSGLILNNVNLSFAIPSGANLNLTIGSCSVEFEANGQGTNCLGYSASFFANAMNSAVQSVQNTINSTTPVPSTEDIKDLLALRMNNNLRNYLDTFGCPGYTANVEFDGIDLNPADPIMDCDFAMINCP
jgi:hypothetical protein